MAKKLVFSFSLLLLLLSLPPSCARSGDNGPIPAPAVNPLAASAEHAPAGGPDPSARSLLSGLPDPVAALFTFASPAATLGCPSATITPPPSLLLAARQDQGQILALSNSIRLLSDQSRSVSQASQQLSITSQQLSQSLQQLSQRLSQTEQQLASARIVQQNAEQASRSAVQRAEQAERKIEEAERRASEMVRSVEERMSRQVESVSRSLSASFSRAVESERESAASVVLKAEADVTALRNEANTQIQQAQGAALSVTQTALAVVGGIIGSSLITVVAFFLIMRHRRNRRQQQQSEGDRDRFNSRDGGILPIGYPQLTSTSNKAFRDQLMKKRSKNSSVNETNIGFYAASKEYALSGDDSSSIYSTEDEKIKAFLRMSDSPMTAAVQQPPAVVQPTRSNTVNRIPRKSVNSSAGKGVGTGYAANYYGSSQQEVTVSNDTGGPFQLGNPPPPRARAKAAAPRGTDQGTGSGSEAGKFTLFPKPQPRSLLASPQQQQSNIENTSTTSSQTQDPSSDKPPTQNQQIDGVTNSSTGGAAAVPNSAVSTTSSLSNPTLDKWLRDGTTVSPFATALQPAVGAGSSIAGRRGAGAGVGLRGMAIGIAK